METPLILPSGDTARLTIDLGALVANWREIAERAGPAEASAVVKADAYGIGLEPAVKALAAAGCRTFFVARAAEGILARAAAPDAVIYVFDGALPETTPLLVAANLRPVLCSMEQIEGYASFATAGPKPPSAIHIDTGMNRLGLRMEEARALARSPDLMAAIAPEMVMSHLACADQKDHPKNTAQLILFRSAAQLFPGIRASLANSGGVFLGQNFHFDLVRPGIALYGAAFAEGTRPLKTVVTAEARILQIREATIGDTVGYGATVQLQRRSRLAIVAVGYSDGYHRRAVTPDPRNSARAYLRGKIAPLTGRVSMDLLALDVTDISEAEVGDFVELFGPNMPVDEVAAFAGTIGYEFLTGGGHRYRRIYVG